LSYSTAWRKCLKQSLPEDKAKEAKRLIAELSQEIAKDTVERKLPKVEENLSKRLATKEDLYRVKEELKEDIYLIKQLSEQLGHSRS